MKTTEGSFENLDAVLYEDGEPFLEHYGVKGMHWGIRNSETLARYKRDKRAKKIRKNEAKQIRKDIKASKKNFKQTEITNKQLRKSVSTKRKQLNKNRSLLTEKELDDLIRRMQKERQLNLLVTQELEPGRYAVKKALIGVGDDSIRQTGRTVTKKATKKIIGKA